MIPPLSVLEAHRRRGWSIPTIARHYGLPSTLCLIPTIDALDRARRYRIQHPGGHWSWPDPDGETP